MVGSLLLTQSWGPEFGALLEGLLANPEVVAVGETGLDYNRMLSPVDNQMDVFAAQVGSHFSKAALNSPFSNTTEYFSVS